MDRYEEVVRQMIADGAISQEAVAKYVPELKESEDEKIRKYIIAHFQAHLNKVNEFIREGFKKLPFSGEEINMLEASIAWLEKQPVSDIFDIAEKEKREFVGDGFIKCYVDFQDFKKGETYWLEYIGNDKYNVRSDNLLGKTYHITPCQLYTIFKKQTWLEKQGEQKPIENKDAEKDSVDYRNYRMSCGIKDPIMLNEIEEAYYAGAMSQKPAEWSEEDERMFESIMEDCSGTERECYAKMDWLKSLRP